MVRPIRPSEVERKRNARTGIRINNSRVKRRNSFYFSHRQIILITIMLFIFLGSGISYVWSNFEETQIGFNLSRLQQQELKLKELNQKLKLELATLKSPQSLEEAARRLGLREALPKQIIILP
ncbi:MAG: cell division protein FtsL [Deltaproteobacteria bacterium]|nr:cell division protein FtsL [Deltaproteobacteria bacterium]